MAGRCSGPHHPLVSVIMPVYNSAKWLPESIASVQAQTLRDWELLVVDDASTDGSLEIAREFADSDPRIRIIQLERNSGTASVPRNRGLAAAKGSYIAFLDADDVYNPERLQRAVEIFDQNPDVHVVVNDWIRFSRTVNEPDGETFFKHILKTWPEGDYWNFEKLQPWISDVNGFRLCILYGFPFHTDSITFSISCFQVEKVWFREDWTNAEDNEFWLRLIFRRKVAYLPITLSYCRIHQYGLSANIIVEMKSSVLLDTLIRERYSSILSREDFDVLLERHAGRLFSLGWNLWRAGRPQEARKYYRQSFLLHKNLSVVIAIIKTFVPTHFLDWLRKE